MGVAAFALVGGVGVGAPVAAAVATVGVACAVTFFSSDAFNPCLINT